VPSSNNPLSDEAHKERLAKIKAIKEANAEKGIVSPDYAALSAAAMNRLTTSPEFTSKYKAWLEYIALNFWGPAGKADSRRSSLKRLRRSRPRTRSSRSTESNIVQSIALYFGQRAHRKNDGDTSVDRRWASRQQWSHLPS
jgi:hypothetical protein